MRKITAFYYLQYPDILPSDPSYASTEMYVEIGDETSSESNFLSTYAFSVYTKAYLAGMLKEQEFIAARSVIIVSRLDDDCVKAALDSILDEIEQYGREAMA